MASKGSHLHLWEVIHFSKGLITLAPSVRKHGNKYEIQYRVRGCKKPFSERFDSFEEANLRSLEIEIQKKRGTLTPPLPHAVTNPLTKTALEQNMHSITLGELMLTYLEKHGESGMTPRCYDATQTRIFNYINPHIGDIPVAELTAPLLNDFYTKLLSLEICEQKGKQPHLLQMSTVSKCRGDIRAALNWGMQSMYIPAGYNAAAASTLPAAEKSSEEEEGESYISWDIDDFVKALSLCKDRVLHFVILMCVACTMRIGELLALDWEHVNVDYNGVKSVYIEYQIQRDIKKNLNRSPKTRAYFIYPCSGRVKRATPEPGEKGQIQPIRKGQHSRQERANVLCAS